MKRETILSILLNVTFVMCIFAVRYFYVKKEYNFLKNDSQRQETLIVENEVKIDSLSAVTRRLQIDNDTQDKHRKGKTWRELLPKLESALTNSLS